ncbi:MAG: IS110 family transposase [Eggerthellaceae bacterium]|nr:IS110 family transposase [Eggerthellaceae bacterium]
MSRYSTYFGMDVHARSTTISSLDPSTGVTQTKRFVGNCYGEIAAWMLAFPQPSHAIYESGCCGFHPARELRALGVDVDIAAVSKLPRAPHDSRSKSDRNDSLRLARADAAHAAVKVYVPGIEAEGLRTLSAAIDDAVDRVKVAKQQILGLLLREGLVWDERTAAGAVRRPWCCDHRRWVERAKLSTPAAQASLGCYVNTLADLEELRDSLVADAERMAAESALGPVVNCLQAMKGCGFRLALAFAAEMDDFSRFRNGRSVSSYFGLVPMERSSGERESRGPVTKSGNSLVRKLAVECSWSYQGASHNPKAVPKRLEVPDEIARHARHGSERLRKRRAHFLKNGMHPCKANVATASEFVRWLWSIGVMVQETM